MDSSPVCPALCPLIRTGTWRTVRTREPCVTAGSPALAAFSWARCRGKVPRLSGTRHPGLRSWLRMAPESLAAILLVK